MSRKHKDDKNREIDLDREEGIFSDEDEEKSGANEDEGASGTNEDNSYAKSAADMEGIDGDIDNKEQRRKRLRKNSRKTKELKTPDEKKFPGGKFKLALRIFLIFAAAVIVLFIGLIIWLSVTEYKPQDKEALEIVRDESGSGEQSRATVGEQFTIMTWNMGYGALGDNADFFMDGGSHVKTASKKRVNTNVEGIEAGISMFDPDVVFLQEVDIESKRSHKINEMDKLTGDLNDGHNEKYEATFAYNFRVNYIPYPVPPIGKVNSGILTLSDFDIESSERYQLPCPFKWPVRLGNLKRCLMVDRVPVYDENGAATGKELVLVNLHLEAYDDGEGKAAQTEMLRDLLQAEVMKGNYVIAGGDFNQTFSSVDDSMYPELEGMWHCGEIDVAEFGDDFQFVMDNSTPTCRSLDQRYDKADKSNFQYYMIDGFIVSGNISVDYFSTLNMNFENTDHNPVVVSVTLK